MHLQSSKNDRSRSWPDHSPNATNVSILTLNIVVHLIRPKAKKKLSWLTNLLILN